MGYSTGLDQEGSVQHLPHTSLPEGQVLGQQLPASPLLVRDVGQERLCCPGAGRAGQSSGPRSRFFLLHPCPREGLGAPRSHCRCRERSAAPLGLPEAGGQPKPPKKPGCPSGPPTSDTQGRVLAAPSLPQVSPQASAAVTGKRGPDTALGLLQAPGEKEKREQPNQGAIKVNCFYCRFNSVL